MINSENRVNFYLFLYYFFIASDKTTAILRRVILGN